MKTINEVIAEMSDCIEHDQDCSECKSFVSCAGRPWRAFDKDALQYLKMYKELAADSEAFAEWKENPPLTWDELKTMERKPVWIEADNGQEQFKHWFIIDEFTFSDIPGIQIMWCMNNCFRFWEQDLGKTWRAYRKERE